MTRALFVVESKGLVHAEKYTASGNGTVDCRATSGPGLSVGPRRPPSSFWLQAACSRHVADRPVFTSKDGLDAVTWLANKKTFKRAKSVANSAKTSGTLT